ncbi:hypothetical protein AGLY_000210 [Aphis glycines]|uniref:Trimethylguanosine synthase n=1 Tax=Aphis glycines TaxID=307491 RepID=A0A6G0U6B8_APHGL|nr:hypothetical protein AGLY_000210 [Aphis glycines]
MLTGTAPYRADSVDSRQDTILRTYLNHHQNLINQNNTNSNHTNHTGKKTHHIFQNKQIPIKYWAMRYMLFTKFNSGIQLDEESFYSVCPEVLSEHIAKRCENNIVCDPFCGAGGNIIQLAMICKKVIAVDIDPNKIRMARHNAEIYGVADKIEFIVGDIFKIYPTLKADVVFMSPPWGGPGYTQTKSYTIETMCSNHVGECVMLAKDFAKVEIQQNIINGKLNHLSAFFGDFYRNSN